MAYHEKDFQSDFRLWLRYIHKQTGAFELKVTKHKSIPLSRLQPHQEVALDKAKNGFMSYKIPDVGYDQKPFDCFTLSGVPAFVVVMYQTTKQRKKFYMIDIDMWIDMKKRGERSMTEKNAKKLGVTCELK